MLIAAHAAGSTLTDTHIRYRQFVIQEVGEASEDRSCQANMTLAEQKAKQQALQSITGFLNGINVTSAEQSVVGQLGEESFQTFNEIITLNSQGILNEGLLDLDIIRKNCDGRGNATVTVRATYYLFGRPGNAHQPSESATGNTRLGAGSVFPEILNVDDWAPYQTPGPGVAQNFRTMASLAEIGVVIEKAESTFDTTRIERETSWSTAYENLIRDFAEANQALMDIRANLEKIDSSLEMVKNLKLKGTALLSIYQQRLERIPTHYVVEASIQDDPAKNRTEMISTLRDSSRRWIEQNLAQSMTRGFETIRDDRYIDESMTIRGIHVEEAGSDPEQAVSQGRLYYRQIFRVYPRFSDISQQSNVRQVRSGGGSTAPQDFDIHPYSVSSDLPTAFRLQEALREMATKMDAQNRENESKRAEVIRKYQQDSQEMQSDLDKNIREINETSNLIKDAILNQRYSINTGAVSFDRFNQAINDVLIEARNPFRLSPIDSQILSASLQEHVDAIGQQLTQLRSDIDDLLSSRSYILWTIAHDSSRTAGVPELAQKLLNQALNELEDRRTQLTSFKVTTVDADNRLSQQDAGTFYLDPQPLRQFILSPLHADVNVQNETVRSVFVLVGQQVLLKRNDTDRPHSSPSIPNPRPIPSPVPRPTPALDLATVSWPPSCQSCEDALSEESDRTQRRDFHSTQVGAWQDCLQCLRTTSTDASLTKAVNSFISDHQRLIALSGEYRQALTQGSLSSRCQDINDLYREGMTLLRDSSTIRHWESRYEIRNYLRGTCQNQ